MIIWKRMNVMRKNVYILKLLNQNASAGMCFHNSMDADDWRKVVRKSKKSSSSFANLKREYSVHKCALNCDLMTDALIKFCNLIIKHNNYPERWLKSASLRIEKHKGPRLDKPRVIQLIEADSQLIMRIF